jgi:hypothetical protein
MGDLRMQGAEGDRTLLFFLGGGFWESRCQRRGTLGFRNSQGPSVTIRLRRERSLRQAWPLVSNYCSPAV